MLVVLRELIHGPGQQGAAIRKHVHSVEYWVWRHADQAQVPFCGTPPRGLRRRGVHVGIGCIMLQIPAATQPRGLLGHGSFSRVRASVHV